MKLKRSQLLAIMTIASVAFVEVAHAGWAWLQTRHPINIRTNANFIGFRTTEAIQNPANCPTAEFYAIPTTYDSKSALAVLLSANLSGRTVSIYVADNLCDATSGRPVVTDVQMDQ